MWLSEQQKNPARSEPWQTGIVTMAGDSLAVRLEKELRDLDLYGPAGYRWSPKAGDRVLVFKGEGERPCIVGVKQGAAPESVAIQSGTIQLQGAVFINGTPLEEYIAMLAKQAVGVTE